MKIMTTANAPAASAAESRPRRARIRKSATADIHPTALISDSPRPMRYHVGPSVNVVNVNAAAPTAQR